MTEIKLGSGDDESDGNSGGGGGGDIVETLEKMQGFLMENPQMAKAFGVDLGGMEETMTEANEAVQEEGAQLDHEFLSDLLDGVEQAGFGDKSVSEVREWVDNNPAMVDNMIERNL